MSTEGCSGQPVRLVGRLILVPLIDDFLTPAATVSLVVEDVDDLWLVEERERSL